MSTAYGTLYSTNPDHHASLRRSSKTDKRHCPMAFAHKSSTKSMPFGGDHEYSAPGKGDVRSVCPALNTMANHGYIPRDGRNLTFFTLFYGLMECYGLSAPLSFVLTLGGFLLISRLPICLPFNVPKLFTIRNPDGSRSQPGVIDLHLIGRHGRVEHNASLVHEDSEPGDVYPSTTVRPDMVYNLVGDVLPKVKGFRSSSSRHSNHSSNCSSPHLKGLKEEDGNASFSSSTSIISRLSVIGHFVDQDADMTASTLFGDEDEERDWKRFAGKDYQNTLVSAADVGRMRARRELELPPTKPMGAIHAEIARGEMAIILGVWEKTGKVINEDGNSKVKKGIPLSYLLTWLAEERLPEGWAPDHVQGLFNVIGRSKAIRATAEAVVKAQEY